MKQALFAILVSISLPALAETKLVCVDKRDQKGQVVKKADGTPQQDCKTIQVHKKLEPVKKEETKK